MKPSPALIRKHLRYDPTTGLLWWKLPARGRRLWRPAGRTAKGRHITVGFCFRQYAAHHLIWVIQTGKWPEKEIDHKNRIRTDNRWTNLRLATAQQNRCNGSLRSDNQSGIRGVSRFRNGWRARIMVNEKEKHIGVFKTKAEAQAARLAAAKQYHGEFASF